MTVQGPLTTKRPEAEARLRAALATLADDGGVPDGVPAALGSLGGFSVSASVRRRFSEEPVLNLSLDDVPESELRLGAGQLEETALVSRLEHRLAGLERLRDETAMKMERLRAEVARAGELLGKPFPHAERLAAARSRVREITEKLERIANPAADDKTMPSEAALETAPSSAARQERRKEWARSAPAADLPASVALQAGRAAGPAAP